MAHHSDRQQTNGASQLMELEARRLALGATGQQSLGKVCDDDRGEIQLAVAHDPAKIKVYLNFGKPVAFVGFTPEQAMEVAESLQEHARAVRGL